jgi:hypothetical protein
VMSRMNPDTTDPQLIIDDQLLEFIASPLTLAEGALAEAEATLKQAAENVSTARAAVTEKIKSLFAQGGRIEDPDMDTYFRAFGFQYPREHLDKWFSFARQFGPQARGKYFILGLKKSGQTMAHGGDTYNRHIELYFGALSDGHVQIDTTDGGLHPHVILPFNRFISINKRMRDQKILYKNGELNTKEVYQSFTDPVISLAFELSTEQNECWVSSTCLSDETGDNLSWNDTDPNTVRHNLIDCLLYFADFDKVNKEDYFRYFKQKLIDHENAQTLIAETTIDGS